MVKGLDRFKAHFEDFGDRYVLIGGTACSLAMEDAGLDFRVTVDLDIVLYVEAFDADFVTAFWEFIKAGGYKNRQKSTGEKRSYRFYDPEDGSYPFMLELFSRSPDVLTPHEGSHLTPIPVDEEMDSLSAIIMDDDYYRFVHEGKVEIDGLPVVGAEHLIPLKARAWLDLTKRRNEGETVKGSDIKKHKNDVPRLYQLLPADLRIDLPSSIRADMVEFIERMEGGESIDLKNLGFKSMTIEELLGNLRKIYRLDH